MIFILRVKTAQIGVGLDAHQLLMFHWTVYLCVFTDTWRASLWESPTASHPKRVLSVQQSGFVFQFFRSLLFGSTIAYLVKTSANFDGLDLCQGHLVRTFSNLDHGILLGKNTILVFPIFDPFGGASYWSENIPICRVLLLIFELWKKVLDFFYMKLVEEPLGALPSCCHLL